MKDAAQAETVAMQSSPNNQGQGEDLDTLWEENMSHFHKSKKGRECAMSLAELSEILVLDEDTKKEGGSPPSDRQPEGNEAEKVKNDAYWEEQVLYNRRVISRNAALGEIERVTSWEKRFNQNASENGTSDEGTVVAYGRNLPASVWSKLAALPTAHTGSSQESIWG